MAHGDSINIKWESKLICDSNLIILAKNFFEKTHKKEPSIELSYLKYWVI